MGELDGKIAVVTGGARGIGRAIALALAELGADVAVGDVRDPGATAERVRATGRQGLPVVFDVGDKSAVAEAFKQIAAELGAVDILCNNAGISTNVGTVVAMPEEKWDWEIGVNLSGAFYCAKQVLPGMVQKKWGRIVCTSSLAGVIGGYGQASYAASKAGLLGLVKTLALEHARDGITANAVLPGLIGSDAVKAMPERVTERIKATIPHKTLGEPEDVANVVAFLCTDRARYMNGAEVHVSAGAELFTF